MEFSKSTVENLVISPLFWQNKKVLLTGHTGFKGSWLTLWLQHLGAHVIGYSIAEPSNPHIFHLCNIKNNIISYQGDIRHSEHLSKITQHHEPDIIFHLAAQSLVKTSYEDPITTYSTNVLGTANVLEAVRRAPSVRAIINVTTDKCYDNKEWVWGYRENDPLGGHDPYSNSKACAELVSRAYFHSFFQPAIKRQIILYTARSGNVFGGGDWAHNRIIPDCIRSIENRQPLLIRYPKAIRPWQHVLEPLHAYLLLAQKAYDCSTSQFDNWNFGPNFNDCWPVEKLVHQFCQFLKKSVRPLIQLDTSSHPHEAHMLALDCAKAHTLLQWRPITTLSQGLEMTAQWYQAYLDKQDLHLLTMQQIDDFQKKCRTKTPE